MSNEEYKVGELVKVKLFATRIRRSFAKSAMFYPYSSYGIVIAEGLSYYDDKEGYYIYVQKLEKIQFFRKEWIKKVESQGEKNEPDV